MVGGLANEIRRRGDQTGNSFTSHVVETTLHDYTEGRSRLLLKVQSHRPAEFAEAGFMHETFAGPGGDSLPFLLLQPLHSSQLLPLVESLTGAARAFIVRIARRLKF